MKKTIVLLLLIYSVSILSAQVVKVPFDSSRWKFSGETKIETFNGKQSLAVNNAKATLPDVQFKNGIIEYDVAFGPERGFLGIHFRAQDEKNQEEYYMRPHQSGNPDAMQYTPVYDGLAGWQLYYGDGHSTAYTYKFDEWMHVKLIVADNRMEVYIQDMEMPVLHAFDLKREIQPGYFELYSNGGKDVRFANFSYQPMEKPVLKNEAVNIPVIEKGTVANWQVSSAFEGGQQLEHPLQLSKTFVNSLKWKDLPSEFTGTSNLAQVNDRGEGENTVIAKFTIVSDKAQTKALYFGYSDIAHVYCNGTLLYAGQRIFNSRDYRYLGTIGYFDAIYLPLQEGENEVWFAVTENFGGWGVRAKFEELDGIKIKE